MRTRDAIATVRGGLVGAAVLTVALLAPSQAMADSVPGPTDLEVTEVTETGFTLKWSEPADTRGLHGYSVRDVESPFVNNQVGWGFGSSTTVEADPDTTYKVAVEARYINHPDGVRQSELSDPVTVTTLPDTEPPATPDALEVRGKSANAVGFRKQLVDDNVGLFAPDYVIEVNGGERFVEDDFHASGWSVGGLESNRAHTFRLRAVDAAGNESEWSDPVSVELEDEPPTVPENIRVEGDDVVWDPSTDNSGEVRYEVFFDGDFRINRTSQPQDDFQFWTDVAEVHGPGEHLFTVEAVDPSRNRSGRSEPFVITVD